MKRWGGLIICLLLSASIWVAHNLSQTFSQVVNVPVLISSNIDGHSQYCSSGIVISAQCSASGYDLILLNRNDEETVIFINSGDIIPKGGDVFTIPASTIIKYSKDIFGSDVKVESVFGDSFDVRFPVENHIKVPVSVTTRVSYRRQYMLRGGITSVPDSVTVYGSPDVLENISSISTKTVKKIDLSSSARGKVRLDVPAGVRVSVTSVEYNIPVSRYVNLNSQFDVVIRNRPADKEMVVIPPKVKVNLKSEFPVPGNPMDNLVVYVDYDDYLKSGSGRCPILCDGLPASVIGYSIEPDFCNCIEKVQ